MLEFDKLIDAWGIALGNNVVEKLFISDYLDEAAA